LWSEEGRWKIRRIRRRKWRKRNVKNLRTKKQGGRKEKNIDEGDGDYDYDDDNRKKSEKRTVKRREEV
jgi:hypothetical protein